MGKKPKIRRRKGEIWSVDGRIIADNLFCSIDKDGNVWSYHDGFLMENYPEEIDRLTSQGVVIGEDPEWRFNGQFVFECDVPKEIRKECPYCEFILKKEYYLHELDEEYYPLDFDSSLED